MAKSAGGPSGKFATPLESPALPGVEGLRSDEAMLAPPGRGALEYQETKDATSRILHLSDNLHAPLRPALRWQAGIRQLIKPVGRGQNGCLQYRERTAVPLTWR